MVLSARSFKILSSANESTMATQCIQERMEKIRGAGWTTLTSREIPEADDDDTSSDASDASGDLSGEVLVEPTEFPDDLADSDVSDPGLIPLMEKALVASADLRDVVENVRVETYPTATTPIRIRRNADGTVTILSHNPDLVYEEMVRVVLQVSWRSKNGRTRTAAAQTIITKNTQ
jgi:hypothetical protein